MRSIRAGTKKHLALRCLLLRGQQTVNQLHRATGCTGHYSLKAFKLEVLLPLRESEFVEHHRKTDTWEITAEGTQELVRIEEVVKPYVGQIAAPRTISKMSGTCPPDAQMSLRPGAMDWSAIPSRMGDKLHYRDGRITRLLADGSEVVLKGAQ